MWSKMSTKQRKSVLLAKSTKGENELAVRLKKHGVGHERQREIRLESGRRYYLDFFIPSHSLAVEIDGASHASRKDKDDERDYEISRYFQIRTIRCPSAKEAIRRLVAMGVIKDAPC